MQFKETGFDGLVEVFPRIFEDSRGYFFESYHKDKFRENGIDLDLCQANQSFSKKGVVRGLHLQLAPNEQAKFVRVLSGTVLDIVVDVRPASPTFGKHYKCILDGHRGNMLYVPRGFAHGFAAMEDTVFHYLCDSFYSPQSESGIRWNDEMLGIDWEIKNPVISDKDQLLPTFEEFAKLLESNG